MKVLYAIANLAKNAVNFWAAHFAGHDDGKEIKGGKFHNLGVVGAMREDG